MPSLSERADCLEARVRCPNASDLERVTVTSIDLANYGCEPVVDKIEYFWREPCQKCEISRAVLSSIGENSERDAQSSIHPSDAFNGRRSRGGKGTGLRPTTSGIAGFPALSGTRINRPERSSSALLTTWRSELRQHRSIPKYAAYDANATASTRLKATLAAERVSEGANHRKIDGPKCNVRHTLVHCIHLGGCKMFFFAAKWRPI